MEIQSQYPLFFLQPPPLAAGINDIYFCIYHALTKQQFSMAYLRGRYIPDPPRTSTCSTCTASVKKPFAGQYTENDPTTTGQWSFSW